MFGLIGIGGAPATGKSMMFRTAMNLLKETPVLSTSEPFPCTLFPGRRILVLGKYPAGETFGGTDQFAMNIQPRVEQTFSFWKVSSERDHWMVWLEGDRLFNAKFISWVKEQGIPNSWFVLVAEEAALKSRHAARDNQNAAWLKGRATKVSRLTEQFGMVTFRNETAIDLIDIASFLIEKTEKIRALTESAALAKGVLLQGKPE